MTISLIDLSPADLHHRLGEALTVYVDAMDYPPGTGELRASIWLEHSRRAGWQAVAALDAQGRLIGVGYGYQGSPEQWWQQQVARGLSQSGWQPTEIARLLSNYFELTELHVDPRAQGHGLGEALARRLLTGRTEALVLLSTPENNDEPNRAWRLYRRLGFIDILRGYHFAGDPRSFAILGRPLPLSAP